MLKVGRSVEDWPLRPGPDPHGTVLPPFFTRFVGSERVHPPETFGEKISVSTTQLFLNLPAVRPSTRLIWETINLPIEPRH